jgi:hypothetical protein
MGVDHCLYPQSTLGSGGANQIYDGLIVGSAAALSRLGLGTRSVLDLVPLAHPWRIVANRDRQGGCTPPGSTTGGCFPRQTPPYHGSPQVHHRSICSDLVGPVGNRFALGLGREVRHIDPVRFSLRRLHTRPQFLKGPTNSFFFVSIPDSRSSESTPPAG